MDQVEGKWLAFDTIGADYFDELPENIEGIGGWTNYSAKAPVFVLWIDFGQSIPGLFIDALDDEEIWFEIPVDPAGTNATLYFNLFREGVLVGANTFRRVAAPRARQLSQAFSLKGMERQESHLKSVLNSVHLPVEWVGVYDVGQGNANAACDAKETPQLYFDLGGGVTQHQGTFPGGLTDFCYHLDPPVVLSHWDWDHWSSGARFAGAQSLNWVVPLQTLGGVHATFAAGLQKAGRLFVWPNSLSALTSGQLTIRKCTGQGAGRNHTGLAMEVAGPNGEEPILLTGDARYSAIPGASSTTFTSLIVPHHGADMRNRSVPAGHQLAGARTAYSFAGTNSYGHPDPLTQQDHHRNNWPQSSQRANAPTDRTTSTRPGGKLGHIGLSWSNTPTLPGHSCVNANCAVELQQV